MTAAEIARALGGAIRSGRGHLARCPAHEDRTPSLSITDDENGIVLVHCHAGCGQREVIHALRQLGLWDDREGDAPRIVRSAPKPCRDNTAESRAFALKLWRRRRPIDATLAETYLREHRGITCPLPRTHGFLPALGPHPPALIAAFGLADETEPGVIAINERAVMAVHLTKLTPDGRKHPDENAKKMIGRGALGVPIVLAPMNDLLGLAITEGIEDALSVHEVTGLGAWAAGSASRMPALADAVPDYADCVTVFADTDKSGQDNAAQLAKRLLARGIHADIVPSAGAAP